MSDVDTESALEERRAKLAGKNGGRAPTGLYITLFLIGILAVGAFVIFPGEIRQLFGFQTSTVDDIQQPTIPDTSISTNIPAPAQPIDTATPDLDVPAPPEPTIVQTQLDEEAQARLRELENLVRDLANRPEGTAGVTSDELRRLLQAQTDARAAELRAQREAAANRERTLRAELDSLRATLNRPRGQDPETSRQISALEDQLRRLTNALNQRPTGPTAEELAEQERLRREAELLEQRRAELERRRAEREAELLERRVSDGLVFDESEEGATSSEGTTNNTGVRELSQNERFLQATANETTTLASAQSFEDNSKIVPQGTIIRALLETAINTELPGQIRAQVSEHVYSLDGEEILMPSGTRLIGTYNSEISIAQSRVLIAWTRAITPDGESVALGSTGIDNLGRAGTAGNVDSRFAVRFGTAALISLVSSIPAVVSDLIDDDGANGTDADAAADLGASIEAANEVAASVGDDLADTTEDVLEEYLSLPPIIRVPQGAPVNVFVNRDLQFL